MMLVYLKYPEILEEEPGMGDLKAAPPRREGYVSTTTLHRTLENQAQSIIQYALSFRVMENINQGYMLLIFLLIQAPPPEMPSTSL